MLSITGNAKKLTAHIPASASLESLNTWARRRKEEEM